MGVLAQRANHLAEQQAVEEERLNGWKKKVCDLAEALSVEFVSDLRAMTTSRIAIDVSLHTIWLRKDDGRSLQVAVEDDDQFRLGVQKSAEEFFYMGQSNSWVVDRNRMLDYVIEWANSK